MAAYVKVLKQKSDNAVAVGGNLGTNRTRDIANNTDCNAAHLVVLPVAETIVEEVVEVIHILKEVLVNGIGDGRNSKESILVDSSQLFVGENAKNDDHDGICKIANFRSHLLDNNLNHTQQEALNLACALNVALQNIKKISE